MKIYELVYDRNEFSCPNGEIIETAWTIESHIVFFKADGSVGDHKDHTWSITRTKNVHRTFPHYAARRVDEKSDTFGMLIDEEYATRESVAFDLFLHQHVDAIIDCFDSVDPLDYMEHQ